MPSYAYPKNQIHPDQKKFIVELINKIEVTKALEVGSWLGESTEIIAKAINNNPLYVVDWFKGNKGTVLERIAEKEDIYPLFVKNMEEVGVVKQIRPLLMDSVEASTFFRDNFFDFMFIDASHDYNSILADLKAWYPKLKIGGIICCHDCEQKEWDDKYINQDVHNHVHHGVVKAMNVFFKGEFNIDERMGWVCKK